MREETKEHIRARIRDNMNRIMTRRIRALNTDLRNIAETNPFGSRLVPQSIWKGSKFERSFVTTFGQGVYEQIALEIAIGTGAIAQNQHLENVRLNTWQDEAINNLLTTQRGAAPTQQTDWRRELNNIQELENPRHVDLDTRFDLYIRRANGSEEYYSIKTVKPNLDQTEIAKRDMLRMSVAKPNCSAFLALPYNPDGEGNDYKWSVTKKLFDMNNSPAVLIGSSFWNTVGADENTYGELLETFQEVGDEFRNRIINEYLEG